MDLVVATRNKHKLKEIQILLKGIPIKVFSLVHFKNVPEVVEDGKTLEQNAIKKSVQASKFLKKLVIADDSGLEVDALGGRPGIFSARFSGKGATYESNNKKLLRLLKDLPAQKRKATFKCAIALADKGKLVGAVEGRCRGRIISVSLGKTGFGYDPVFIPHGYKKTFAQMGMKEKNKISHRSRALTSAKKLILQYLLPYL